MLKNTEGFIARAQKTVLYGPEGIGKSTLASCFPNPLFLDMEGGTAQLNVRRIAKPSTVDELIAIIDEIAVTPSLCGSLIIDTADWMEMLCIEDICKTYKKPGIEEFGFGKGYVYLGETFARVLAALDKVIAAGIHVVITAHAKMRKFEQPDEMGAYDRWEMKLTKHTAPLLKEWADLLLFCNYQTFVVTAENKSTKAQGGKRVMYTSHHPCWDAKNRHSLPEVLDLDYSHIAHIFDTKHTATSTPAAQAAKTMPEQKANTALEAVVSLMEQSGISEPELMRFVTQKGYYKEAASVADYPEKFLTDWVAKYWSQITTAVMAARTNNT